MITGFLPRTRRAPNNNRRFRQPRGYFAQRVTDPRFNHALRRDAFFNAPTSSTLFKTLLDAK